MQFGSQQSIIPQFKRQVEEEDRDIMIWELNFASFLCPSQGDKTSFCVSVIADSTLKRV
jgi:hypothetical protein